MDQVPQRASDALPPPELIAKCYGIMDGIMAWVDVEDGPMMKTGVRVCVPLSECDKQDHDGDWQIRACYTCHVDVCSSMEDIHLLPLCARCYEKLADGKWGDPT